MNLEGFSIDVITVIAFHATINTKLRMICTCKKWYNALNKNQIVWKDELKTYRYFFDLNHAFRDIKRLPRFCAILLKESRKYRLFRKLGSNTPIVTRILGMNTYAHLDSSNRISYVAGGGQRFSMSGGVEFTRSCIRTGIYNLVWDRNNLKFIFTIRNRNQKIVTLEQAILWLETDMNFKLDLF